MNSILGNLLDIERGVLVHQVNCLGVMGAGLAAQIREKWPIVYRSYRELCARQELLPGNVQFVEVADGLHVANLAGQYGFTGQDGVSTIYEAYPKALARVCRFAQERNLQIYVPKNIGCGIAGGSWKIMLPILEAYCPDATIVEFQPPANESIPLESLHPETSSTALSPDQEGLLERDSADLREACS